MNVWCTLVMLKSEYACGAAAVAQSLANVGTKYPVWCMISDDISAECEVFLAGVFAKVVRVPLIAHECVPMKSQKQNQIYGGWIHQSFTKWNAMNPEYLPVDKVILVDADMLFLENCDSLFDLQAPAATFSSPWVTPYMARGGRNHYGEMQHGQVVDPRAIGGGLCNGVLGLACMVLLHPSARMFTIMKTILNRNHVYGHQRCMSGFDEQLLAETMLAMGGPVTHIHQQYNWIVGKTAWLTKGETPKSMQYYNGKPWREASDATEWQDVKDWHVVWQQLVAADPSRARWLNYNEGVSTTSNSAWDCVLTG
jgi:hypothetical protein